MNGSKFVLLFSSLAILAALFLIGSNNGWFNKNPPPVFAAHTDFEAAIAAAHESDRMLVIDMTASWCPPCGEMDRSVWVDPDLAAYLTEFTIPIQIDVDENQELADLFNIKTIPTIIAVDVAEIEQSLELDRKAALIEAPELMLWLQTLDASRHLLRLPHSNNLPQPATPATPTQDSDDQ